MSPWFCHHHRHHFAIGTTRTTTLLQYGTFFSLFPLIFAFYFISLISIIIHKICWSLMFVWDDKMKGLAWNMKLFFYLFIFNRRWIGVRGERVGLLVFSSGDFFSRERNEGYFKFHFHYSLATCRFMSDFFSILKIPLPLSPSKSFASLLLLLSTFFIKKNKS